MTLRPDELASMSNIEAQRMRSEKMKSGLKTAANLGLTAVGAKIVPFLSPYITVDNAMKGINKVAPQLGAFLKRGMDKGLDLKNGLNFIKENLSKTTAANKLNIVEQYSGELHNFLKGHIEKGKQPLEAGALAQIDKKFEKIIKKMESEQKAPFSSILESVYGSAQKAAQPAQAAQQQAAPTKENTDAALITAIEKILAM